MHNILILASTRVYNTSSYYIIYKNKSVGSFFIFPLSRQKAEEFLELDESKESRHYSYSKVSPLVHKTNGALAPNHRRKKLEAALFSWAFTRSIC